MIYIYIYDYICLWEILFCRDYVCLILRHICFLNLKQPLVALPLYPIITNILRLSYNGSIMRYNEETLYQWWYNGHTMWCNWPIVWCLWDTLWCHQTWLVGKFPNTKVDKHGCSVVFIVLVMRDCPANPVWSPKGNGKLRFLSEGIV